MVIVLRIAQECFCILVSLKDRDSYQQWFRDLRLAFLISRIAIAQEIYDGNKHQ